MVEKEKDDDIDFMIPITALTKIQNMVDRYFLRFYKIFTFDKDKILAQYAFQHTNRLVMVGITSDHQFFKDQEKAQTISFDCLFQGNLKDIVKGKKKLGKIQVRWNTPIAEIQCYSGKKYTVYSSVEGFLIDINEQLVRNPHYLLTDHETKGHFAFIQIKNQLHTASSKHILTPELYV